MALGKKKQKVHHKKLKPAKGEGGREPGPTKKKSEMGTRQAQGGGTSAAQTGAGLQGLLWPSVDKEKNMLKNKKNRGLPGTE